jgi:uncharacterized membrane protein
MSDRRALFFVVAGLICFALAPLCDAAYRWVAVVTGVVYMVLALLSALDHRSKQRE